MKKNPELISKLENILNSAAKDLKKVTTKKMFGCHALFADGNVFALVWKHGQIGVKLTTTSDYEDLMSIKGSKPWKAGAMQMLHWVLIAESIQNKPKDLKSWVKLAHTQALHAPSKKASHSRASMKANVTSKTATNKTNMGSKAKAKRR